MAGEVPAASRAGSADDVGQNRPATSQRWSEAVPAHFECAMLHDAALPRHNRSTCLPRRLPPTADLGSLATSARWFRVVIRTENVVATPPMDGWLAPDPRSRWVTARSLWGARQMSRVERDQFDLEVATARTLSSFAI